MWVSESVCVCVCVCECMWVRVWCDRMWVWVRVSEWVNEWVSVSACECGCVCECVCGRARASVGVSKGVHRSEWVHVSEWVSEWECEVLVCEWECRVWVYVSASDRVGSACECVRSCVRERAWAHAVTRSHTQSRTHKKKHNISTTGKKKNKIVGAHKNCACIHNKIYHTNDGELRRT